MANQGGRGQGGVGGVTMHSDGVDILASMACFWVEGCSHVRSPRSTTQSTDGDGVGYDQYTIS